LAETLGPNASLFARALAHAAADRAEELDAVIDRHAHGWSVQRIQPLERSIMRVALIEMLHPDAAPAEEPIPARLRVARLMAEQRRGRHLQFARIAAAVALLIAGGIGGWGAHDLLPALTSSASAVLASAVFDDAIAAHRTFSVETRHPVEVGANEEAHLVQWLSKRLGHQLIVPDLGALGFQLMGGRLLPADSGPAALFMYEDGKGTRLSCYYLVADVAGETEFQFREQNGISAFYWVEDGLAYAIAANAPRNLLLKVAEIVYQQNSPEAAKTNLPPVPGKPS